jgi:RNA polymerase-binding transcription factor DksA
MIKQVTNQLENAQEESDRATLLQEFTSLQEVRNRLHKKLNRVL